MKIGIIGSGTVGKVLAEGFIKHGYDVMIGTRDTTKLIEWANQTKGKAGVGSFAETAEFGDILVLAVKGIHAKQALSIAGRDNLNKVIIDVTNPIAEAPPTNGVIKFFTSLDSSFMEQLQKEFSNAKFVKAFNSIGNNLMVNPEFGSVKPSMFICGNDDDAKKEVRKIVELFGFEVEDMGKVEAARAIEPLCILWCIPGFLKNDWMHGFKMLRK